MMTFLFNPIPIWGITQVFDGMFSNIFDFDFSRMVMIGNQLDDFTWLLYEVSFGFDGGLNGRHNDLTGCWIDAF